VNRCLLSACLVIVAGAAEMPSNAQTSFREELNRGVQAYKQSKYEEAAQYFSNAILLDPENVQAHLFLATTYEQQYIPGVHNTENNAFAEAAVSEYEAVLKIDPLSITSLKGIASLRLQSKRFEEAKSFYQQAMNVDGNDPENYYFIGVVDWTQAYSRRMSLRKKLQLGPERPFILSPECWELRSANDMLVKNGMEMLTKALQLRPAYDDAMAYMNLMYRERAEIQCSDPANYGFDIKKADRWVDLTISSKKAKAAKADEQPNAPPEK
jgi:tetratricopeptide (TPR) repeat protein